MRIRSQLLLVAAVIFIPGFIASVIAVQKVREGERQAALRGLEETVRATTLLVDGQLQRSVGVLTALAESEHLRTENFPAFYEEALASNQPPDVWTLLLDDKGRQVLNTAVPFGTPPPPTRAADRVARTLASNHPYVSDLSVGPATGKLLTTMYLATKAFDGRRYVVAQAFSVDHWKQSVLLPADRASWTVGVLDRTGKFIARNRAANERLGQQARSELVAAAAAQDSGLIKHFTHEGMEAYDAFAHSKLTGWTIAVAAPVNAIEASATQAVAWLVAGGAFALVAAILAALYWGRTFIAVIDTASTAARQVGLGERPNFKGTSLREVNVLYQALVDAGDLLAKERAARTIAEDQRARLLEQETTQKETALRQNAAKDEFLALLGHELRNPLAAISSAAAVLSRTGAVADASDRSLKIIERQNNHLRRIVDDLLEVSRMLSGKITLEPSAFNLAPCVRGCVETIRGTEPAHHHRVSCETTDVWIHADLVRIEQIVNNLLSNALKFSGPGDSIHVTVKAVDDQAILEVTDEGPGIEDDLKTRIFEPFFQGPARPGQLAAGLGIGLSLVKQLVALHGGEIGVRRGPGNVGSTFHISLPRIAATEPIPDDSQTLLTGARHILFVEDNADALESTTEVLQLMGHKVCQARNGQEAIAAASSESTFDVVLLDIGLPDMSGYEVAAELRELPAMKDVLMVALTGFGQQSDKLRALAAGFDVHLTKPADPKQLSLVLQAERGALST